MKQTNHSLSPLQQVFADKQEEAQGLLSVLEENATELCVPDALLKGTAHKQKPAPDNEGRMINIHART